ncbi:hypothetical protein [Adhaeretor mobilis]|uniref:Uncharacterized protein n=1 Tax=Adhaeretor mobilis TaxID=1930276 RepID=A0A517N052_9BACT|nr:hypothetical protein [Adhaeretor mobilis]QDT00510.1 hypothetical protein HG15A2_38480 [Adhaeretor mobilis]
MSSIPNISVNASAAGAPLSAKAGSTERAKQDTAAQQRTIETDLKADDAAGIGHTEEDQPSSERDADGRRLWEGGADEQSKEVEHTAEEKPDKQAKDTSGEMGNVLDLTG